MKKNQKGFTTVELLICFVIISVITISIFGVILNYKNKQQIVSIKGQVHSYVATMTKMIEDDLLKLKLSSVDITSDESTLHFQDGSSKILKIINNSPSDVIIQYGTPDNLINYPIPSVESLKVASFYIREEELYGYPFYSFYLEFYHPDILYSEKIDIHQHIY